MAQTTLDNPKIAGVLAQTYAKSLFDLSEKEEVSADVTDELTQILQLLHDNNELKAVFDNRSISAVRRGKTIEVIFKGRISDLAYNFLRVLNDKGRLAYLASICVAFGLLIKEKHGEVDVDVYVTRPLDDEQLRILSERIGEAIERKAVVIAHVDESMIGGVKIRIGDSLVDGSISTQLRRLRGKIIDNGREWIRKNPEQLMSV